ncbi:MAG: hypothetical protein A3C93_05420 [Candidatus Lloydbacteria bacterium RIFCSPHIGHO2_02_FULL_54_17]|uniref:HicB-like antitoxin of toxin-antitoxin system domain-containing protein n=1 Tax=Candidatus Lloydbacteria bacterium RIFCSPHIGHO2_02_FULL_54_17 TaxID=1798664 RepID=A0A1G2DGS3_9BACT|nr:MAG: hypothetical protein A3C93_05420 [Candidatus Lloydbacteria bacterium RIFCSPHIGHO2_02_FULL_54_17]OGZ13348.1 MAG: hypothetical protein A2948_04130 [Candidatus Lloydbacteria bacterium RIFCSPLOWO2_01_FULL_54_18]
MKTQTQTYHFPIFIEKDKSGYFVSCPSLQGCYTQGKTYEDALAHIHDAIQLHLADRIALAEEIGEPKDLILSSIKVSVSV